jgi:hypothetical protein
MDTLSYPTETKAKKNYVCDFCGQKINIGENHFRVHKYCHKLSIDLDMYKNAAPEGVDSSFFQESIHEEHYNILCDKLNKSNWNECSDILQQLRLVNFRDKLWYVIRYYKNNK